MDIDACSQHNQAHCIIRPQFHFKWLCCCCLNPCCSHALRSEYWEVIWALACWVANACPADGFQIWMAMAQIHNNAVAMRHSQVRAWQAQLVLVSPWLHAAMRLLYVTTLGMQPSLCMRSNSCSAISQRPAFSQALIKLL